MYKTASPSVFIVIAVCVTNQDRVSNPVCFVLDVVLVFGTFCQVRSIFIGTQCTSEGPNLIRKSVWQQKRTSSLAGVSWSPKIPNYIPMSHGVIVMTLDTSHSNLSHRNYCKKKGNSGFRYWDNQAYLIRISHIPIYRVRKYIANGY